MKVELRIECWHEDLHEGFECELKGEDDDAYFVCPKCKREIRLILKPSVFLE